MLRRDGDIEWTNAEVENSKEKYELGFKTRTCLLKPF